MKPSLQLDVMERELLKLNALKELSSKLIVHYRATLVEQKELLAKLEEKKRFLLQMQEEQVKLIKKEFELQKNLEAVERKPGQTISDDLAKLHHLLGYTVTDIQDVNDCKQITLHYGDCCYIEVGFDENCFRLLKVYPEPQRIEEIKALLQQSQDMSGLLARLQKFFQYVARLKASKDEEATNSF